MNGRISSIRWTMEIPNIGPTEFIDSSNASSPTENVSPFRNTMPMSNNGECHESKSRVLMLTIRDMRSKKAEVQHQQCLWLERRRINDEKVVLELAITLTRRKIRDCLFSYPTTLSESTVSDSMQKLRTARCTFTSFVCESDMLHFRLGTVPMTKLISQEAARPIRTYQRLWVERPNYPRFTCQFHGCWHSGRYRQGRLGPAWGLRRNWRSLLDRGCPS